MKKWMYGTGICAFGIIALAGCALSRVWQPEASLQTQTAAEAPEPPAEEKTRLEQYEAKYLSGEFSMEDYYVLAGLYAERGSIKRQRDMLEESYRLNNDGKAFDVLQNIAVNLEEESPEIREQAMLICQNLELEEYKPEAIHMMEGREWFETLMPKMAEGVRQYFLPKDGRTVLFICAGYDENQKSFSNVWYQDGEGRLTVLSYSGGVAQVMETSLKDGRYDGAFSLWVLDGTSGSILNETGTFAAGAYSGEYTLKIYKGKAQGDPFDLWNNRENMKYAAYTAKADEQGKGDLEQMAAKMMSYPEFRVYGVEKDREAALMQHSDADVKARVFDGVLQIFYGGVWISMGNAEQYIEQDPLGGYEKQKQEKAEARSQEKEGIDLNGLQLPAAEKTPADSKTPAKKPTAQIPAAQAPEPQKPAVQPAPQAPAQDNDDNGGGGGNSDSGGSSDSGSGSGGNSGGGSSDSGGSSGGDNGGNSGGGDSGSGGGGNSGGGDSGSGGGGDSGGGDSGSSGGGDSGGSDNEEPEVDFDEWAAPIL